MAIFNSDVKLPEGKYDDKGDLHEAAFFCHIRPLLQPAFPFLVSSPDHTFASFAEPNAML